jgi:N-acetylglucosaminyldiphosphoundecaprenol N-acetyl-beta-D-mannosaminyltransferase
MEKRPRRTVTILGCPIDAVTMEDTVRLIDEAIREGRSIQHGTVYASKLALMRSNPDLHRAVTSSDIINGEGQSLVWLSRFHDHPLPERVVGLELFQCLLDLAHRRDYGVYLFGARREVMARLVRILSERYSPGLIAGWRDGYFHPVEEESIAREIAASGAHMLFVGISSPIKELFLYRHAHILRTVPFRMGVGGSFDVLAGKVRRAPVWMQRCCLEWLYRFLQEPGEKWEPVVVDSFLFLFYLVKDTLYGPEGGT